MEGWEPRKDRGHPVLTVGNRYLSNADNKGVQQSVLPLGQAIDPLHILQDAVPSGVHTAENQVLYFQRSKKGAEYVLLLVLCLFFAYQALALEALSMTPSRRL